MRPATTCLWVLLAVVMTAAPAYAVSLSPTPFPLLPDGTFQAADGDQVVASGLTDWTPENAAGRVAHAPDPNALDSAFTGGSKENAPFEWALTSEAGGVQPAKVNIRDAWGSLQAPGSRTFLNLAFARETEEGTAFLTFELNRAARLWDNGGARIPCRTTGDLLVSYEPQGNTVNVLVERWGNDPRRPRLRLRRRGPARRRGRPHAEHRPAGRPERRGDRQLPTGRVRCVDPGRAIR